MSISKYATRSSITMIPRTPIFRYAIIALLLVTLYFYHPALPSVHRASIPPNSPIASNVDSLTYIRTLLKNHKVGPEIEYASRTIRYLPDAAERKSISRVNAPLFPQEFASISIDKETPPASKLIDVHVHQSPRPDQVEAGSLIFGVSTTYERFSDPNNGPIKEWVRWLTDGNGKSNGATLILALFNTTDENLALASTSLQKVGISATVVESNLDLDMPGRYVDLARMLYEHPSRPNKQWLVLVDDDTFFPFPHELQRTLGKYDTSKPYYIGTFTERLDWLMNNHAPFAYGGGGVFLTVPTAEKIATLPCLKKKEDGKYVLSASQGDYLLYKCLREYTEITTTYLPSLHQQDQFGDLSGFYESGQQPLSLHHYKSWHSFSPGPTHLVSDACGEDCVFQRFRFADNYILTNGYSLAYYPQGIDFDPYQTEGTFTSGDAEEPEFRETVFSYAHGQLRKSLSRTGRKRAWQLLGSRSEGGGRVKQVYLKSRGDRRWYGEGETESERDSIVVLTWIP